MNTLIWLGILLVALWALGWLVFNIAGAVIHLLLIAGVILLVWWVVKQIT